MIAIEKVTSLQEFEALESAWNPLLENSANNTIALTWEWLSTWWKVFGGGERELNILVARDAGQIVGIAPLLRRTVQHYGWPFTRLEFLGTGEDEADEICSEYLDFIIQRGREAAVIDAILKHMCEEDQGWDEVSLDAMLSASLNLSFVERLAPDTFKHQVVANHQAVHIPLPRTYAEYFGRLGSSLRRDIRHDRRTASANGVDFKVVESAADFDESFRVFVELHAARWTPQGLPGVFASPKFRRFHTDLAEKLVKRQAIKLFLLSLAGRPIAGLQVFAHDNTLVVYQSGLALTEAVLAHPGTLVRDMAIEWAIEAGFSDWDMLRMRPGSYKLRWSGQMKDITSVRLARPRSKEIVYATTARVVDGLRQIRRALR
jgi:CelD/BcsL family acetyltransferase involved in cellulose biosynthesis